MFWIFDTRKRFLGSLSHAQGVYKHLDSLHRAGL